MVAEKFLSEVGEPWGIPADWESDAIRGPLPKPDTLTLYVEDARADEPARGSFEWPFVSEVGAWPMGCVCDFHHGFDEDTDEAEIAGRRLTAQLTRYLTDAFEVTGELRLVVRDANDIAETPSAPEQAIPLSVLETEPFNFEDWATDRVFVVRAEFKEIS